MSYSIIDEAGNLLGTYADVEVARDQLLDAAARSEDPLVSVVLMEFDDEGMPCGQVVRVEHVVRGRADLLWGERLRLTPRSPSGIQHRGLVRGQWKWTPTRSPTRTASRPTVPPSVRTGPAVLSTGECTAA